MSCIVYATVAESENFRFLPSPYPHAPGDDPSVTPCSLSCPSAPSRLSSAGVSKSRTAWSNDSNQTQTSSCIRLSLSRQR
ncbi:hypothetical protein K505DRAFT_165452 [Melanomma pulvis-pyrius CBS 109.77]|uniref:Uncharacterized protein n=1 Tax=Melanomma pulvis-pyrius CBS 109.77 TaxID=1314802 RepID=A0A6A6WNP9_9PLEO|nr:hypothetical protein K505DRAFT_165452 [Melanomma pulvis-pyrius CBS 109.77]